MIAFPAGMKVWIAARYFPRTNGGHWLAVTDMRRGMNTLALQVQQGLGRDPYAGEIFCFRGRAVIWSRSCGTMVLACRCI